MCSLNATFHEQKTTIFLHLKQIEMFNLSRELVFSQQTEGIFVFGPKFKFTLARP